MDEMLIMSCKTCIPGYFPLDCAELACSGSQKASPNGQLGQDQCLKLNEVGNEIELNVVKSSI